MRKGLAQRPPSSSRFCQRVSDVNLALHSHQAEHCVGHIKGTMAEGEGGRQAGMARLLHR